MKTSSQIAAHIDQTEDMFGWRAEVLIPYMDYKDAKQYLKENVTEAEWDDDRATDEASVHADATDYLDFAFGKALDHRGLSASRSVEKIGAWLWMLELDVDTFDNTSYTMYGVPQLMFAAEQLEVDKPTDERLVNMGQGSVCEPGCMDGC